MVADQTLSFLWLNCNKNLSISRVLLTTCSNHLDGNETHTKV